MILKSVGRYYRNKILGKGFIGLVKGGVKAFTSVMVISMVLTMSGINPTAVAAEFKEKASTKIEDIKEGACDWFAENVADVISKGDYSSKEGVQNLSNSLAEVSETFANENGVEFTKVSVARVVDGDTIVIDICGENCGDKNHEYKVRLIGVNTPESVASEEYLQYKGTENTEEGKMASDWLKSYLKEGEVVYLEKDTSETDKYDRLLRYVWLTIPENEMDIDVISTDMLNAILLENGYAEVAIYKPDVKYADYFTAIERGTTDDFAIDR